MSSSRRSRACATSCNVGELTLLLNNDGHVGLMAVAGSGGESGIYAMDSGGMAVAGVQSVGGNKGQVGIFHGGTNIAALTEGTSGAELELDDMGGTPMVQAETLPNHTGIVKTGPASRAPGGLMGVPGSYITGKGQ